MADPIPTYAPRTDFGDTPTRESSGTWAGSSAPGAVPQGMSPLFWDEINNSPEAEKLRREKGFRSDETVRAQIDALIRQKWQALPPDKQQAYAKQDERGSKNSPGSPAAMAEDRVDEAKGISAKNQANVDSLMGSADEFEETARRAAEGDQAAMATLEKLLGSIEDPKFAEYVGDYISQAATAGPSQQAIADQRKEYEKLSGQTDATINAEERLMMETSRRQQEQDLRSQRGAFANDLQGRGMFGSGAELQMNLAQSQESSQRRAMEEMTAQAHAQERARLALDKANEVAGTIRTSEAEESQFRGGAADKAKEFALGARALYDTNKAKFELDVNRDKSSRALGVFGARTGLNRDAVTRGGAVAGSRLGVVSAQNATRTGGFELEGGAIDDVLREEALADGKKVYG